MTRARKKAQMRLARVLNDRKEPHGSLITDESILKDHSDNWWNVLALCSRVFRYAAAIEDF